MITKFYYEQTSTEMLKCLKKYIYTNDRVEQIEDNSGIVITVDEVNLTYHEELRPAKVYYYPNENVYAYDFKKTKFRNSFGFYTFFQPTYITTPYFNFKYNEQYYTFLTNCEYILKFAFNGGEMKLYIYFNTDNISNKIFKIETGKNVYPPKFNIYIPPIDTISYKLFDYIVFGNYRFFNENHIPNIVEEKKWLIDVLNGLDFYFMGTSIFDYARDIDIHINEQDYDEAVKRLNNTELSYDDRVNYGGIQYGFKNGIKVDIVKSPYTKFQEPKIENTADPLLMYFIQTNYYCSIAKDNVTDLFKEYRYSRLLDTHSKIGIDFGLYNQFVNQSINKERYDIYLNIIKDGTVVFTNIQSDLDIQTKLFQLDNKYYLIIKSKYNIDTTSKVIIPLKFTTFNVLDNCDVTEINMISENDNTQMLFRNLKNYTLVELIQ